MMATRVRRRWFILMAAAMLTVGTVVRADEHPQEHPSEPPTGKKAGVTKEALARAIADYVRQDAELKGGHFLVYDRQAEKPLVLRLDRVHEDRLSMVGDGRYFACADFKTPDGRLYDLDIFMKESDAGLQVSEISVHKEGDVPRYTWKEEQGVWKRQEVGQQK